MYIGEMPHWGRNVAALYIHTHTYIYIFSSLGRCFQRRLMGWAASGVGAGGQAGGGCEGGLCSAFTLKALSFQPVFPHKYVCVYPKA